MAEGYFYILASNAEKSAVEAALEVSLSIPDFELTRQLKATGTAGPTTHWLASDRLTDAQQAALASEAVSYASIRYVMWRTLDRGAPHLVVFEDWLATMGLEVVE